MKEIKLTQGKATFRLRSIQALVDDEDFERLNQRRWEIIKMNAAKILHDHINGKQEYEEKYFDEFARR